MHEDTVLSSFMIQHKMTMGQLYKALYQAYTLLKLVVRGLEDLLPCIFHTFTLAVQITLAKFSVYMFGNAVPKALYQK